jgi:hypothetical protein
VGGGGHALILEKATLNIDNTDQPNDRWSLMAEDINIPDVNSASSHTLTQMKTQSLFLTHLCLVCSKGLLGKYYSKKQQQEYKIYTTAPKLTNTHFVMEDSFCETRNFTIMTTQFDML